MTLRFSLMVLLLLSPGLRADNGVAVLASRTGTVTVVDASGDSSSLQRQQTLVPSGQRLTVADDGAAALVLSNGASLYLAPGSSLTLNSLQHSAEVRDGLAQRPFETSSSNLDLVLHSGDVAISHPNRRASSRVTARVGPAVFGVLSNAFILSRTTEGGNIALVDGTVTISDRKLQRLELVQSGQVATVRDAAPQRVELRVISQTDRLRNDRMLGLADAAAETVVFEHMADGSQPRAVIVRNPSHFMKRPVNGYILGGRNYY